MLKGTAQPATCRGPNSAGSKSGGGAAPLVFGSTQVLFTINRSFLILLTLTSSADITCRFTFGGHVVRVGIPIRQVA
jgi:hypothetical protein